LKKMANKFHQIGELKNENPLFISSS